MPLILTDSSTVWPAPEILDARRADPALPGQSEWCELIPSLHRALMNPTVSVPFPALGSSPDRPHVHAYYETVYYLMRWLIGWKDPGKGLRWWYQADHPGLGDPRLEALKDIWLADGYLDLLAAWCWVYGPHDGNDVRRAETFLGDAWLRNLDGVYERFRAGKAYVSNPYFGGSNSLHLGHSTDLASPTFDGELIRSNEAQRRAVLLVDRMRGWYPQLEHFGRSLPNLGDRSWYVDVVAKPLGWLGTFRLSHATGRWFSGKHSIHAAGN